MGPAGTQIDADEIPASASLIDAATGGDAYRAELYFVHTREFTGFTFGGRIDDVQDPADRPDRHAAGVRRLRAAGHRPGRVDHQSVRHGRRHRQRQVSDWVSDQLLKVMRTDVTTQIVRNGWPILGSVGLHARDRAGRHRQGQRAARGLRRGADPDGQLRHQPRPRGRRAAQALAKDTSYSRLAGSFNQYAAGEMALGAGEGMAQGGGAVGGAFLAAGLGMGGQAVRRARCRPPPRPRRVSPAAASRWLRRPAALGPAADRPAAAPARPGPAAATAADRSAAAAAGARRCAVRVLPDPGPAGREVLHELRHGGRGRAALHQLRQRTGAGRTVLR